MKSLNVVDLDKTLIAIDSFRYLVFKEIDFPLLILIILRALKIISRYKFAQEASEKLKKVLSNEKEIEELVRYLISKINNEVLEKVRCRSTGDAVTVIVSASPEEYVKKIANRFGFLGMGSYWEGGRYFHCYGPNKIEYLEKKFPKKDYIYNFVISDSKEDISLLSLFKTGVLLKKKRFTR